MVVTSHPTKLLRYFSGRTDLPPELSVPWLASYEWVATILAAFISHLDFREVSAGDITYVSVMVSDVAIYADNTKL